jgi:hypothetical protein
LVHVSKFLIFLELNISGVFATAARNRGKKSYLNDALIFPISILMEEKSKYPGIFLPTKNKQ